MTELLPSIAPLAPEVPDLYERPAPDEVLPSRRRALGWMLAAMAVPPLAACSDSEQDQAQATAEAMFEEAQKDAAERHANQPPNAAPTEQHYPHETGTKSLREWQDFGEDPVRDVPNFFGALVARFLPSALPGDSGVENFFERLFSGGVTGINFLAKGAYAPQTLWAAFLTWTSFWGKKK